MVNFFIGRPIFATVLALLMLLVGGICVFIMPISLYPDIVPPQVQVTTTYTGKLDGDTIKGKITSTGGTTRPARDWTATRAKESTGGDAAK